MDTGIIDTATIDTDDGETTVELVSFGDSFEVRRDNRVLRSGIADENDAREYFWRAKLAAELGADSDVELSADDIVVEDGELRIDVDEEEPGLLDRAMSFVNSLAPDDEGDGGGWEPTLPEMDDEGDSGPYIPGFEADEQGSSGSNGPRLPEFDD